MSRRRNPNAGSGDLPNYLTISTEKHIQNPSTRANRFSPTKRPFPQLKYGVSPDAPIEFHNKNSMTALSSAKPVLINDPIGKLNISPIHQNKEPMMSWPMKNTQTGNIDNAPVYHKFETKPVKPKELYNCILDEKRIVQRPELIIGEESIYTKKFYAAVQEQKAFHKKVGYFQHFMKHHKTTNEDYKFRRSNSNGHTRYTSKPILLTSLNTKNNMSIHSTENHSKILQGIKEKTNASRLTTMKNDTSMNQSHIQDNNNILNKIDQTTLPSARDSKTPRKVEYNSEKHEVSDKNGASFQTHKNFYSLYLRKGSAACEQTPLQHLETLRGTIKLKEIKRTNSVQPLMRPESSLNTHNPLRDLSSGRTVDYTILKPEFDYSFRTSHRSIKYKTKEIGKIISKDREQAIKIDPTEFVKHETGVDYQRDANILASVIEKNRKHTKVHHGGPVRYQSTPHQRPKEKYSVNDNLSRFDRHIERLKFNTKNFGSQRWFYDKNWQLNNKINLFESQVKLPEEEAVTNVI